MNLAVKARNISKHYLLFDKDYKKISWVLMGRGYKSIKRALDNINFEVKKGEVVGIIGPNGAGKSTLMKLVAGITFPTTGMLTVNGKVGALINLNAGFNNEFTGRQNIYYKAAILGMKKNQVDLLIDEIIDFTELGEYFDMPVKMYSSGMSARLGFALATFSDPDILIVDEVFAVGDRKFKKKSKMKTEKMFRSGKSILFSSHSDALIKEFCHRVLYIENGEIKFDGDVEQGLSMYNDLSNDIKKKG